MNRPHDAGWLYWVGMNVFTHPFNSFVSRRFFLGINYMQAASPAIRAWGIQKKKHTVTGPSPPQNKGAGYLCGYLYARGSGKAATPQDSWESERSEYLGKALKLKEDPWERWHIYLSIYIYIYIYIYVVDFCGNCKWTDIYSTIHGSFGYGRCQVWQFENVSLIHGSEFVLLIELSTLMYCLVYPGNWTWFKLRLVWRVELMEMCCKTMFPSWWVCLHTETLFQCGMYVDLGK